MLGGLDQTGPVASAVIRSPGSVSAASTGESALQRARAFHSATMLPDGKVLVIGGIGLDGQIVDSAEVFDPDTQTSELLSGSEQPPPIRGSQSATPRVYHTATLLTEALVLITGGLSAGGEATRSVELMDAKTKVIVRRLKLRTARYGHSASLLPDGRVLISGGSDNSGRHLDSGELFDRARAQLSRVSGNDEEALARPPTLDPSVSESIPADGAADVAPDAVLALRFSRPLTAASVNSRTVALASPFGQVEARIVPAEAGMLAFITPSKPLLADSPYTLTVSGATDRDGRTIIPATIRLTTVHARAGPPQPSDGEDWIPDRGRLGISWRTNRPESGWRSLPPLEAQPGVTALAGQALILNGAPLRGVTLKVDDKSARTDETGRFLIQHIQAGHRVLVIDGRTASTPAKTYGVFEASVEVETGKTNPLQFTIWMPGLDIAHEVRIPSPTTTETVITTPLIPGLEVHIPAGAVIRDIDGKVVKKIGITAVPLDRPPFPLPKDVYVPVYFTVQPGGAYVEVPNSTGGATNYVGARLIYPNYRREGSGTRFDFWHYDPDQKGWYVYGKGTVAQDQNHIVPDLGVAVHEFTGAMVALPSTAPPSGPPPGECAVDGDPVDLASGLFVLNHTDLFLPDTIPIQLTRTYRPQDTITRSFGIGTTHSFEIFLIGDRNPWTYIELVLPDGGRVHYNRISPGASNTDAIYEHTSTPTAFYKSRITWDPAIAWNLRLKDGTVYTFRAGDGATVANQAGLLKVRDRNGNTVNVVRDTNSSNLIKVVSPNGRYINFTYDSTNRVTQATDNIGRTVSYSYDSSGRLSQVTDPIGGVTQYTYDSSHRMLTVKNARGIVYVTNQYDSNGRVMEQTHVDGGTYQFAYNLDSNHNVTQATVTDPRGNVRQVSFGSSGYPLTDARALGKPEQETVSYTRQAGTNLLLAKTDPLGRVTSYAYDAMGNDLSVTRLSGTASAATTTYTYDPLFNQVTVITDPLHHSTTYAYDSVGNQLSVTNALGSQTTFTYNTRGQRLTITDPLHNTTQLTYDGGDLIAVTDPLGNRVSRFVDAGGRTLSISNATGQVIRFGYDSLNRPTRITDPLQGQTSFTYDGDNDLLNVTDARSNVTSYTYDNMDRPQTRTDPLMHVETYSYDLNGNLTAFTDRRGKVTILQYDGLNREVFAGFGAVTSGGTSTYESTVASTYDAGTECGCGASSFVGRLRQVVDSGSGTIAYTYDDFDHVASEGTPQGTVGYTYDAAGRRISMSVPGQSTTIYTYDSANELTQIAQGAFTVGMSYDAAGRPTSVTLPNGVMTQYSYDAAPRVSDISYVKSGSSIGNLTYQYNAVGRRAGMGGSFGQTVLPQAMAAVTYNAANQEAAIGSQPFSYDANGNMTSDGTNTYQWDARNRLISMSGPGLTSNFQYDPLGRRVSKTINGAAKSFLYDGDNVVQEQAGGTPSANILTGLGTDEIFMRTDASGARGLLTDALGSTIALTDSAGAIQAQYTYEPFGETTASGGVSSNSAQYTARENDGAGLYYYRARYYSPRWGRFVSEDPSEFSGGLNLYVYVGDAPTNLADPLGLRPSYKYGDMQHRKCKPAELAECERMCGPRGVKLCEVNQVFRVFRVLKGRPALGWVDVANPTCSCNDPDDGCEKKKVPVPQTGPTLFEQNLLEQSARYREQFWKWVLFGDYLIGVVGTGGAFGGAGAAAGAGGRVLVPVP
jgi:RHS repeat-associated protein